MSDTGIRQTRRAPGPPRGEHDEPPLRRMPRAPRRRLQRLARNLRAHRPVRLRPVRAHAVRRRRLRVRLRARRQRRGRSRHLRRRREKGEDEARGGGVDGDDAAAGSIGCPRECGLQRVPLRHRRQYGAGSAGRARGRKGGSGRHHRYLGSDDTSALSACRCEGRRLRRLSLRARGAFRRTRPSRRGSRRPHRREQYARWVVSGGGVSNAKGGSRGRGALGLPLRARGQRRLRIPERRAVRAHSGGRHARTLVRDGFFRGAAPGTRRYCVWRSYLRHGREPQRHHALQRCAGGAGPSGRDRGSMVGEHVVSHAAQFPESRSR